MNYNPLFEAGCGAYELPMIWHTPGHYQPDVIEEDMTQIAAMGMNSISLKCSTKPDLKPMRNLLDTLRRAERHGLKVNMALSGADPLNFDAEHVKALMEAGDLANNEAIFAYDIAWEPQFGGKRKARHRADRDPDWIAWVKEQYGSVDSAEKDWGCALPRQGDALGSPSDEQLFEDGEWTAMALAYRRFTRDTLSRSFRDATVQLRSLDPHHLISFRSGAGAAGGNKAGEMPYDYIGVAKSCDMLCPEGWSIKTETQDKARLTTAYCRMVAPKKPVMWAEFGFNAWDAAAGNVTKKTLAIQGDTLKTFYDAFLDAGAQGGFIWRWTGWFRPDEVSDFGVCPPDRGLRPQQEVIRQYAPRIYETALVVPDVWLDFDPDAHAAGYHQAYMDILPEFAKLRAEGKRPGLKWAVAGKTSADVPLIAVGNRPYDGNNPPKYLNAEFNYIRIENAKGEMVEAKNGAEIPVKSGAPIHAEASVGNTGPVEWLAAGTHSGAGGVYLSSRLEGGLQFEAPMAEDTPSLGDAKVDTFVLTSALTKPTAVRFEMTAKDRAWFGEKVGVTLKPVS
ncbi:MAG: beta-galactosidase [Candidatus Sumerlaeota bacterium]|nr:beta-galactosidase [Candidatus Sumerlaeota bacterium]